MSGPVRAAALLSVAYLSTAHLSGCKLGDASAFGADCSKSRPCGDALVCDALEGICLPPAAIDRRGASCADPTGITSHADDVLWRAHADLRLTPQNTADADDGALSCGEGRVHYIDVTIPARLDEAKEPLPAIVLELRATSDVPVSVAFLDSACGEAMPHACASAPLGASPSVVLPYVVPGTYRVAVIAPDDDDLDMDVRVELHQVACPAGFLPEADGCRGFVTIPGPPPRTRHDLVATSERSAIAIAGRAPDGESEHIAVFDRRLLLWTHAYLYDDFQEPCGFVSSAGELFVLAGGSDGNIAQVALVGFHGFLTLPDDTRFFGVGPGEDCLAVPLSDPDIALVLGGYDPIVLERVNSTSVAQRQCGGDFVCEAGEACVARFPASSAGVCTCMSDGCESSVTAFEGRLSFGPRELYQLRGSTAVTLPSFGGDAAVLVLGGVGQGGPIAPHLYLERERLWAPTDLDLQLRTFADSVVVGDVVVVSGGIVDGGAQPTADGLGSDVVELLALGANLLDTVRLAAPRRDSALAAYSPTEALVLGGRAAVAGGASLDVTAVTEIVDTQSGAVRTGPTLPRALHSHRAVSIGDEVLVAGGANERDELIDEAFLLIRTESSLRAVVTLESFVSSLGGDTCEDATNLVDVGGRSGSLVGTTLGRRHNYSSTSFDDCDAFLDGLDVVFRVDLRAGERFVVEAAPTQDRVTLTAAALSSCPPESRSAVACVSASGFLASAVLDVSATEDGPLYILISRDVPLQDDESSEERPFGFRLTWDIEDAP